MCLGVYGCSSLLPWAGLVSFSFKQRPDRLVGVPHCRSVGRWTGLVWLGGVDPYLHYYVALILTRLELNLRLTDFTNDRSLSEFGIIRIKA